MSEQTNFQAFDSVLDKGILQNYINMRFCNKFMMKFEEEFHAN
ncbi:hypothetical protein [Helicobacter ailurogastricus]|uniref:Uncharacterized protein n=1 Tax=Helicobacter ailurogastricus TaxID=1578720 RepID=A0A0K2Y327_9HELI|nr:hypothetical protein [Helicobacter ailurogastricus]CRF52727.1 hypothetical protein HAL07_11920 [Helicobacter ailurogastricus]BDQ28187.1 hypothetical protein ASB7_00240 [Helicobacter ailurogastricus]GLH57551.1 hypothetical protein NHP214376_03380 [Helicobacter ailurogastricus]GLH59667.1 hypothetical protein NHP214377_09350 [Helicobacter ailurogastricus]GMB90344.1 hypothetical protein NHP190002_10350 [Helicobacter ailurogastricus]